MLNIAEASGWVAFTDSDTDIDDTEDYRILIQRESTGEVLFDSSIPLARGLRTHGFEMSREDARLINIASTVDSGILPPLSQRPSPPNSAETEPSANDLPPLADEDRLTEENLSALAGVKVIDSTPNALILELEEVGILKPGDRLFLRTPPETLQDPESGEILILSRGNIAALLEVTAITENLATATLMSGTIPPAGYLQRVDPQL